jgi:hypothetical protein
MLYNDPAAITAYKQIRNWMVGAVMTSPCSPSGTVWNCTFTRPGGYHAVAVWNTARNSAFTVPSGYTRYRDLAGKTRATAAGASVTIGVRPLLFETKAP